MIELIKFALPILVAALAPILVIWITHLKDRKESRDRYNEKRLHDFLSLCADYISVAKSGIFLYDDDAESKIASMTVGIRKEEAKLRLLTYFTLESDMRKRLEKISYTLEKTTMKYSRTNEEFLICREEYGNDDQRTREKCNESIALSHEVQAIFTQLETLFIEREGQLRKEWFN